jgi:hypothetical protein
LRQRLALAHGTSEERVQMDDDEANAKEGGAGQR